MGTRGAYGFHKGGVDKVSYNHFDSYPDGLGASVVEAIQGASVQKIRDAFGLIEMVDENVPPTPKQIKLYKKFLNAGVGKQSEKDWYCLLREAQGNLSVYFSDDPICHMIDSKGFLFDSLFCEYAYIINLDSEVLEVYKGFNKEPGGKGRYASFLESKPAHRPAEYYGVVLVGEIPLEEIQAKSVEEIVLKMEIMTKDQEAEA